MSIGKKIRNGVLILLSLGACVGVLAGGGFLGPPKASDANPNAIGPVREDREITISVDRVARRELSRTVNTFGTLHGREEIPIQSQVEGRVVKIHKDTNAIVKPGELLFELDPTNYVLSAAEAKRAYEYELSRLDRKELPDEGFNIASMPAVVQASAQERNAKLKLDRARTSSASTAAEELAQRQTEYDIAKAAHKQAMIDVNAMIAGARRAKALWDSAEQRLRDTKLYAPQPTYAPLPPEVADLFPPKATNEYLVSGRLISSGQLVRNMPGENSVQYRLVVRDPLRLIAQIPERFGPEVKVGQKAELRVESHPGLTFPATVVRINELIDSTNRCYQVEIWVNNSAYKLSPGSFAKVAIRGSTPVQAKIVPKDAVASFAGVNKVFVIRSGRAVEVPVRLGVTMLQNEGKQAKTWIEVEGDLHEDEHIAVSGLDSLFDGVSVKIR